MESCHNDGNRRNNVATNLRWDTHKSNCADRTTHGTQVQGERQHNARFTDEIIRSIRAEYATGKTCYRLLGEKYGTHWTYARAIIKRRVWKHIA